MHHVLIFLLSFGDFNEMKLFTSLGDIINKLSIITKLEDETNDRTRYSLFDGEDRDTCQRDAVSNEVIIV